MIRIATMTITALLGWLIGLYLGWPLLGAGIGAVAGLFVTQPEAAALSRGRMKVLEHGTDAVLILFWIAGPALRMLCEARPNARETYEDRLIAPFIADTLREDLPNEDELIALFEHSMLVASPPLAAIRRHNRRYQPTFYRKETPTFAMLREAARILVEAGAVEETVDWYLDCAAKLRVSADKAMPFMIRALEEQAREPTMLPGRRVPDDPIVAYGIGLARPPELAEEYDRFARNRAAIVEIMFPTNPDSEAHPTFA